MRITITDIRKAGHCVSGARRWFETQDMDFRDFLKDGIDSKVLLDTGDAFAVNVVRLKRERDGSNG